MSTSTYPTVDSSSLTDNKFNIEPTPSTSTFITSNHECSFDILPPELILQILYYIDHQTIISKFSNICKEWNELCFKIPLELDFSSCKRKLSNTRLLQMLNCPMLINVKKLNLNNHSFTQKYIAKLAQCEYLLNLEELFIKLNQSTLKYKAIKALDESKFINKLKILYFGRSNSTCIVYSPKIHKFLTSDSDKMIWYHVYLTISTYDYIADENIEIPDYIPSKFEIAVSLLKLEKYASAIPLFVLCAEQSEYRLEQSGSMYYLGHCYDSGCGVNENVNLAFEWFMKSAQKGNSQAQFMIGWMYEDGSGCEISKPKAVEWYHRASANNNPSAMYSLATRYERGADVELNGKLAVDLYLKSAKKGYGHAICKIALLYMSGSSPYLEQSEEKAFHWYLKAANLNNVNGQFNTGRCYALGIGTEKDFIKAMEYYMKASQSDHALATNHIGYMYLNGQGVDKDDVISFQYFLKSAELGWEEAMFQVSVMYRDGIGIEKDEIKSEAWLIKSAQEGFAVAQHTLGVLHLSRDKIEEGLHWIGLAAQEEYPLAQYELGDSYLSGTDGVINVEKGIELLVASANQGCSLAQFKLGLCYCDGTGVEKSMEKAFEWFKKGSEQEHALSELNLATMYLDGEHVEKDNQKGFELTMKAYEHGCKDLAPYRLHFFYDEGLEGVVVPCKETSIEYCKIAAENNSPSAQHSLAMYYRDELKDYENAFYWAQKSADANELSALDLVGYMYYHGEHVAQDYSKALEYFLKGAELDDEIAQFKTYNMYWMGLGCERDIRKGFEYLEKSVANGHPASFYEMALFYEMADLTPEEATILNIDKDIHKSIEYYKKAAESEHIVSMHNLGLIYERGGDGIEIDYEQAIEYYEKSANLGYLPSQNALGHLYHNGLIGEVDEEKSAYWCRKAAEQGDSVAQFNLGYLYDIGAIKCEKESSNQDLFESDENDTKEDTERYIKAMEWYMKSIQDEKGERYGSALCNIGSKYENGDGVELDMDKALEYYEKSAQCGNAHGQSNLACILENQFNDLENAFKWYLAAAEQGDAVAQFNVGSMYGEGKAVEQDYQLAMEWLLRAAEQDSTQACYCIGGMYRTGLGVEKNAEKAAEWLEKAAEGGTPEAIAVYGLYHLYENFKERDLNKAFQYLMIASDSMNLCEAQLGLALMYQNGVATEKNMEECERLLRENATEDDCHSMYQLGTICLERKETSQAIEWFEKAIQLDENFGASYFELAKLFLKEGNFEKAFDYFKMSSETDLEEGFSLFSIVYRYGLCGYEKNLDLSLELLNKCRDGEFTMDQIENDFNGIFNSQNDESLVDLFCSKCLLNTNRGVVYVCEECRSCVTCPSCYESETCLSVVDCKLCSHCSRPTHKVHPLFELLPILETIQNREPLDDLTKLIQFLKLE